MAKKKRGRSNRSKAVPVALLLPLAIPAIRAYQQKGSIGAKADRLSRSITGVSVDSGQFNVKDAMPFWMAMGAGIVIHKIANNQRLGVNNAVRSATMGFLKL